MMAIINFLSYLQNLNVDKKNTKQWELSMLKPSLSIFSVFNIQQNISETKPCFPFKLKCEFKVRVTIRNKVVCLTTK